MLAGPADRRKAPEHSEAHHADESRPCAPAFAYRRIARASTSPKAGMGLTLDRDRL